MPLSVTNAQKLSLCLSNICLMKREVDSGRFLTSMILYRTGRWLTSCHSQRDICPISPYVINDLNLSSLDLLSLLCKKGNYTIDICFYRDRMFTHIKLKLQENRKLPPPPCTAKTNSSFRLPLPCPGMGQCKVPLKAFQAGFDPVRNN